MQRALLGEITPNTRMITGSVSGDSTYFLKYYYENDPTAHDLDNVSTIGANIDASLGA